MWKRKEWCSYNIEKKKLDREYRQQNKDKLNEKRQMYINERLKTDVIFRLIKNTRCRIHHALKRGSKSTPSKEILGIDTQSYKNWIEFKMTPEMNWSNIHIDHVKPISSFNVVMKMNS